MKNCGHRFHVQVANKDFIDGVLVKIISPKANPPTIVQDKVLSLIQVIQLCLFYPLFSSNCPRNLVLCQFSLFYLMDSNSERGIVLMSLHLVNIHWHL